MSMIQSDLLLGQEGGAGYQIERSLRFSSTDGSFLSRTPSSAGNRKTWTISTWLKRASLTGNNFLLRISGTDDATYLDAWINSSGQLFISGYYSYWIQSVPVYRDPSAWYHLVIAANTTAAVASERFKVYVNGGYVTGNYNVAPTLNSDLAWNRTAQHNICGGAGVAGDFLLADFHSIDGQALTPTSFGEFDTNNVWQPKAYSGTYGTNGFRLDFSDNSAATATTLGKDRAGSNNWTPNNLSVAAGAGNDSLVDSPSNYGTDTGAGGEVRGNYCTLNPVVGGANIGQITFANGNLEATWNSASGYAVTLGTIGVSSGKWYWETTIAGSSGYWLFGIATAEASLTSYIGFQSVSIGYYSLTGDTYRSASATAYGSSYTTNDVIGIALDLDNGKIFFSKNGTWQNSGSPTAGTNAAYTGLSGTFFPAYAEGTTNATTAYICNFGQRQWAFTPPAGFKALCTQSLPPATITNGATAMDVKLYTGTDSSQAITGLGFSPDLVWGKTRNGSLSHVWMDTVRGTGVYLRSNLTSADAANTDVITSFNSNGFTLGSSSALNSSAYNYAAWCWDAGSSTVTNTSGSISSQVRANASAGFSVVTYTGNGTGGATVGHGLGVAPSMVIVKRRDTAADWPVWHRSLTSISVNHAAILNLVDAAASYAGYFNGTNPTSSVFSIGSNGAVNASGGTYVAYCWAPVAGYSAFGSYTGNGSTDGPFIYTGFRPRFLLVKLSSGSIDNWFIQDTARSPFNVSVNTLSPDSSSAEANGTFDSVDILSNGFKPRDTNQDFNGSGFTYIYAAFAENPFALARAR